MRGEKNRVIRDEGEENDKGLERNCNFLCSTTKMFIKLMRPLQGKQARHEMQYWQIY